MSPIFYREKFVYGVYDEVYDFGRTQNYIKESASLCRQKNFNKLLMDIRGVTGKISTWDRFKLAQSALQHFGWDWQVTVVYREEEMNGFFEDVVVNRGGNFRIFSDLAPACNWLGIEESAVVVK
jgi:hypothetical protein